ncbi:MAG: GGDEF domain-containing protein [Clostridiales bacterium]|nr:GGDEF domain-containing protein [Clostridiales bacterium]
MILRHFVTLFVILLFSIKLWSRKSFRDSQTKYFWVVVISCLVLVFEDFFELLAATSPSLRFWRIMWSVIGYTFRSTAALGLLLVVVPQRQRKSILWIPSVVTLLVSSTAFFTDIVFGYDESYEFYRGPCGYVVFVIPLIYLLLILWYIFSDIIESKGTDKYIVLLCVAFCLGATTIDATIGGTNLIEALIISSIFLYIFLYSHDNRRDSLTGLFNRKAFYDDCSMFGKSIKAVASLDMNGLKGINDTQGHEAGDKALVKIGECITRSADKDTHAYRTGGDEFIILFFHDNEDVIRNEGEQIKKKVTESGYNISVGYALLTDSLNLEDAIVESDKRMYEDKARYYQETGLPRRRV